MMITLNRCLIDIFIYRSNYFILFHSGPDSGVDAGKGGMYFGVGRQKTHGGFGQAPYKSIIENTKNQKKHIRCRLMGIQSPCPPLPRRVIFIP
jgi:hypothetical protein